MKSYVSRIFSFQVAKNGGEFRRSLNTADQSENLHYYLEVNIFGYEEGHTTGHQDRAFLQAHVANIPKFKVGTANFISPSLFKFVGIRTLCFKGNYAIHH
jgi:hypothetical protein